MAEKEKKEKPKSFSEMGLNEIANKLAGNAVKSVFKKKKPSKKVPASAQTTASKKSDNKISPVKKLWSAISAKKISNIEPEANPDEQKDEQAKVLKQLTEKIDELETIIKAQKKTSEPAKKLTPNEIAMLPPEEKKKHAQTMAEQVPAVNVREMEDAQLGLQALGYNKAEAKKMLQNAKPGQNAAEMIKSALQAYDNAKSGKAVKLPKADVPQAVAAVKPLAPAPAAESHHVPPLTTPAPTAPPEHPEKLAMLKPAAERIEGPSDADKAAAALSDVKPTEAKPAADCKEDAKEKAEREKKQEEMDKKLESIRKSLTDKSPLELLNQAFGFLGKKIWGMIAPALSSIAGPVLAFMGQAMLVIGVGLATYKIASEFLKKFGYTGETLGKLFSGQDKAEEVNAEKYKSEMANFSIKQNEKLKGTGFSFNGGSYINNETGQKLKTNELPADVRAKLVPTPAAAQVPANAQTDNAPTIAAINNTPKSDMASTAVAPAPATPKIEADPDAQRAAMMQPPAPPVVVNTGGGKTAPVMPKQPVAVIIKVRNDEPTFSTLAASMFDHPVMFSAVYRM